MPSKKKNSLILASIVVMFASPGCGDEPAKPPPALTFEDAPEKLASLTCGKVWSCCTDMERVSALPFDPPPATQSACETQYAAFVAANFASFGVKAGIDEGRLVFNVKNFEDCLASADKESCSAFHADTGLDKNPDCADIFEGTVAVGGACGTDDDCLDADTTCDGSAINATTGMLTLGQCKKLPIAKEPCLSNECATGLICGGFGSPDMYQCDAPAVDGAPCTYNGDCASGYCVSMTKKCTAPSPNGMTCSQNAGCESGYCDGQTALCVAPKADGASCTSAAECASGGCEMNLCGKPLSETVCNGL